MTRVIATVAFAVFTFSLVDAASTANKSADTKASSQNDSQTKEAVDVHEKDMTEMSKDQDVIDILEDAMSVCNETFRTDMAYIISLNESGSFPDETERTPKCFVRCVLEMTGVASSDGQYEPERTAVIFAGQRGQKPMNDIEEIAKGCIERKESCKCERAYQYMKCLMESEIKKYSETR